MDASVGEVCQVFGRSQSPFIMGKNLTALSFATIQEE